MTTTELQSLLDTLGPAWRLSYFEENEREPWQTLLVPRIRVESFTDGDFVCDIAPMGWLQCPMLTIRPPVVVRESSEQGTIIDAGRWDGGRLVLVHGLHHTEDAGGLDTWVKATA